MSYIMAEYPDIGRRPHALLNRIWYVNADNTYAIFRNQPSDYDANVLVRTISGCGHINLVNGRSYALGPNSLVIYNNADILNYSAADEGWKFYWFEFQTESDMLGALGEVYELSMSTQERMDLERCLYSLESGISSECMLADMIFNYRLTEWHNMAEEARRGGMPHRTITELLEKGRQEGMSISDMAHEAGMCERSFRDAVHSVTGLSPKAYILKGEMASAMELLRTSSMSISDISACFNYSSPFYFSCVFKKYYGVSPQSVRNNIKL